MKFFVLFFCILLTACKKTDPVFPEIKKELKNIEINSTNVYPLLAEDNELILIASRYMGYNERRNRKELTSFLGVDPVRIDWCAAFVNSVLREAGYVGSESVSKYPLTARSFLRWGKRVREPEVGDIVVFPRGTEAWQGHVGFYYGTEFKNGEKFFIILGGNQSDSVTLEYFRARSAISIRRLKNAN